jgi:hypothetical protein
MFFKRNQVEEAISRTLREPSRRPSPKLRARLKRLLDLDRDPKHRPRTGNPDKPNYAFYSSAAPGRGFEIMFSDYEAFALVIGLRLLEHGWPQSFVVNTLRRIRHDLEAKYTKILQADPSSLPDPDAVRQNAQPGDLVVDPDSAFLLIVSDHRTVDRTNDGPYSRIFPNQREAFRFQLERAGRSCTWLELNTLARISRVNLVNSLPKSRGRSG